MKPLEALVIMTTGLVDKEEWKECYSIIQNALLNYERLEVHNLKVRDLEKKIKTIEIIKELVNSYDIDELPDSWFELLRTWLNARLPKEKLDLLREVLL